MNRFGPVLHFAIACEQFPFSLPITRPVLSVLLLCLAGCGGENSASPPAPPKAAAISWDFEGRSFPNRPDAPNVVPPVVLTENGNHFGRLTATPSDCRTPGNAVWDPCPIIREQIRYVTIPEVEGETRTYSFSLRIPSVGQPATGHDVFYWQIVEPNATGANQYHRSFWFGVHDFGAGQRVFLANRVPPCPGDCIIFQTRGNVPASVIDLGPLVFDQWDTYEIIMTLAVTPKNGTVVVKKNGKVVTKVTNQPTMYLVDTQEVKIDVLDWSGTQGIADFDNLVGVRGAPSTTVAVMVR